MPKDEPERVIRARITHDPKHLLHKFTIETEPGTLDGLLPAKGSQIRTQGMFLRRTFQRFVAAVRSYGFEYVIDAGTFLGEEWKASKGGSN